MHIKNVSSGHSCLDVCLSPGVTRTQIRVQCHTATLASPRLSFCPRVSCVSDLLFSRGKILPTWFFVSQVHGVGVGRAAVLAEMAELLLRPKLRPTSDRLLLWGVKRRALGTPFLRHFKWGTRCPLHPPHHQVPVHMSVPPSIRPRAHPPVHPS